MSVIITDIDIDCEDPKGLAEFWAAAAGFDVEHAASWQARVALGDETVEANEEWVSVKSGTPGFPRLVFAKVHEGKVVKNRIHLDLKADDMNSEVARLADLGAVVVEERSRSVEGRKTASDDAWTVMQDPEGNEFCIS